MASSNIMLEGAVYVPPFNQRERIPKEAVDFLVRQIAEQFHPERIILFGSYAYGTPDPESDVNLLVVMDTPTNEFEQASHIKHSIKRSFELDLLLRTPDNLARRIALGDFFLRDIVQKGSALYGPPVREGEYAIDLESDAAAELNPLTAEWIERAESHYVSMEILAQALKSYDHICFYAQLSAEAYLKAYLQEHKIYFPKTYDFSYLLQLCLTSDAEFETIRSPLQQFTQDDAENYVYPGYWADASEANALSKAAASIRNLLRAKLGL